MKYEYVAPVRPRDQTVEKSCILAGLDPYVGFLHTDNYNKKSMVFDLIEPFRFLADQTVTHLFTGRKIKEF